MSNLDFAKRLLAWYQRYGRHDLPWQKHPTAYRVWVSEIMLQQTQVATVIAYYQRFMQRFPTNKSLALSKLDEVLNLWSGLGYYARARNLHRTALLIQQQFYGRFPKSIEKLMELPGIGRSTAGAIISFAYKIPATILDGNVKRVLTRHFAIAVWPGNSEVNNKLWRLADGLTPQSNCNQYNQAIMDLGATICRAKKPLCTQCPVQQTCQAYQFYRPEDFPQRKPKNKLTTKSLFFLILQNPSGEILFEKRPPVGIWGGLWSFPECEVNINLKTYCFENYQCHLKDWHELENITHQFSHFKLIIRPVFAKVDFAAEKVMESSCLWSLPSADLPGGIPAPIKILLNQLSQIE